MEFALPCMFAAVMITLLIAAIVTAIRLRRRACIYWRFGLFLAAILLVTELGVIALLPGGLEGLNVPLVIGADAVAVLRVYVFAIVGIHLCRRLGWPDAPLLRRWLPPRRPLRAGSARGVVGGLAVGCGAIAYSAVLFILTSPRISATVKSALGGVDISPGAATWPLETLAVLQFAFAEEVVFRLGIQAMLAYALRRNPGRDWIAILLTTLIWTIGHTHTLEPEWVKLAQVFPVGIALGWLQRRYGLECAVLAHAVLNVSGRALLPLITVS